MSSKQDLHALVDELYQGLEVLPYHLILGVAADADGDTLREAFHHRAQEFHPDLFYRLSDDDFRAKAYAVYKRITEAYRVLSDPVRRREYTEQREKGNARYDASRRPQKTLGAQPHVQVSSAAHKYYRLAMNAQGQGDLKSAKFNLKLALQLDRNNAELKALFESLP